MKYASLKLVNFRNHSNSKLQFANRFVGFTGPNGAGKTSVLDAIHYLSVTRGLSASTDGAFLKKGAEFFRLEAEVKIREENKKLVVKYAGKSGKTIEVDGEPLQRLSDHVGNFPVVSMIPQDIELILSGSRERRRMIDLAFSQIDRDYFRALLAYRKLLRQRNAHLKSLSRSGSGNLELIAVYDQKMAPHANLIFEKRKTYTLRIDEFFKEFYRIISGGSEQLGMNYKSQLHQGPYEEICKGFLEKDKIMGRSHSGIHKDDLELILLDNKLKDVASQGQLKSAVLSLKMSIYKLIKTELGIDPLFLIDDLFDRLDASRAKNFLSILKTQSSGQIFLTDTNRARLAKSISALDQNFTIFSLENGEIIPQAPIDQ